MDPPLSGMKTVSGTRTTWISTSCERSRMELQRFWPSFELLLQENLFGTSLTTHTWFLLKKKRWSWSEISQEWRALMLFFLRTRLHRVHRPRRHYHRPHHHPRPQDLDHHHRRLPDSHHHHRRLPDKTRLVATEGGFTIPVW